MDLSEYSLKDLLEILRGQRGGKTISIEIIKRFLKKSTKIRELNKKLELSEKVLWSICQKTILKNCDDDCDQNCNVKGCGKLSPYYNDAKKI